MVENVIRWIPLVQVKVEIGTFEEWEETTGKTYKPLYNEPSKLEYVTKVKDK